MCTWGELRGGIIILKQKRQIIMLVDDNQANLVMGKNMLKDFYEVYSLPSAERLFKFLETITPDLILLDVEMPIMNGLEVIRILKANTQYAEVPVIFVTSNTEKITELEGLSLGAVDYVTKPFSAAILLKRIENHLLIKKQKVELRSLNDNLIEMVKKRTSQVYHLQNSIISTIAEIVEFRDAYTGGHIRRTQKYVQLLVDYLIEHDIYSEEVLAWENMDYIAYSTQLHDLGKVFISDTILNKPGKLTAEEFEVMKTHVEKGVKVIKQIEEDEKERDFLHYAELVAGTHHEKWDGTGYPSGLKELEIPLLGRLMAIADVYDALTSVRPYKEPFTTEESAKIIIESSGTHFDPVLVDVFKNLEKMFALIAENSSSGSTEHDISV